MKVPTINPVGPLAPLAEFVRSVRAILTNGWTIKDQAAGEVKTIRWNGGTITPVDVSTTLRERPLSVVALAIEPVPASGLVVSGPIVVWQWVDGAVRVSAISPLGSDLYDVTLWIVGG